MDERQIPERVRVILDELNNAAYDYQRARDEYQRAQLAYDLGRERLVSLKKLGAEVMGWLPWYQWLQEHEEVRFTGESMGDAVLNLLRNQIHEEATKAANDPNAKYLPWVNVDKIVEALEAGGYEFKSIAPQREVNAALINLSGVTKFPGQVPIAFYKAADDVEIFKMLTGREPVE